MKQISIKLAMGTAFFLCNSSAYAASDQDSLIPGGVNHAVLVKTEKFAVWCLPAVEKDLAPIVNSLPVVAVRSDFPDQAGSIQTQPSIPLKEIEALEVGGGDSQRAYGL